MERKDACRYAESDRKDNNLHSVPESRGTEEFHDVYPMGKNAHQYVLFNGKRGAHKYPSLILRIKKPMIVHSPENQSLVSLLSSPGLVSVRLLLDVQSSRVLANW